MRGLDEMPFEAQQRLAGLLDTFSGRLRLLASCGSQLLELNAPTDDVISESSVELDEERARGLCSQLIDVISSLTIVNRPLAQRVEDIPLIATAMLDTRHAAGEGPAERINRAALDALVVYPWPHNYEELEHAIRTRDPNRSWKCDCLRTPAVGDSFLPTRREPEPCQANKNLTR